MLSRPAMVAGLLGASIGVPYALSNYKQGSQKQEQTETATKTPYDLTGSQNTLPGSSGRVIAGSRNSMMDGTPIYPLGDVLRMDVSQQWVYARWPRKSTGLSDLGLFGIRVPLVTGTDIGDLAGSLTYYFNGQGSVQHLSFCGHTGDTRRIAQLVQQRFGLQPQPPLALGEQLYQTKREGRVQSQLRLRTESVLRSSTPHSSYYVELEIEHPSSPRSFDTLGSRPPTSIAGIPVTQQQIQYPQPVPVGPLSVVERVTNEGNTTPVQPELSSSDAGAAENSASDAEPQTQSAAAETEKQDVNLGIRRRMRWGS